MIKTAFASLKNRSPMYYGLLLLAAVLSFYGLIQVSAPQTVNAQSAKEVCANKKRPEACVKAVNKTCKDRTTPTSTARCRENRATDFADTPGSSSIGTTGDNICGTLTDGGKSSDRNVHTKFDFGCLGTAYEKEPGKFPNSSKNLSPILDFLYAIIRFLSIGVGIVITIALIVSGIQYSASEGNAEASTKAKKRVESALTGLVIYVFSYALLQFLIPGGVFK